MQYDVTPAVRLFSCCPFVSLLSVSEKEHKAPIKDYTFRIGAQRTN